MKLVRNIDSDALPKNGCVLTIGNFDAVHIGHQQILARLRHHADRLSLPLVVMTFDPHPEEYFRREVNVPRLTNCSSRFFALQQCSADVMLCLRFDKKLAETSAEEFIVEFLVNRLHIKHIIVGDDFRFGKQRKGDFALLKKLSTLFGYGVEDTNTIISAGDRVSSSRIKHLLGEGDLQSANQLLGRSYNMVGRVIHGQKLGRQWGFPTINLAVKNTPALNGIFAVKVSGLGQDKLKGVASLGNRPNVDGTTTLLEVFLFDFDQSVYGLRVCVEFIEKIRDEQKFETIDLLKQQIHADAQSARKILG